MLAFELLQRSRGWSFDFLSALIGALFAWFIAALVYASRNKIKRTWEKVWAPIAAWRRRVQASKEEKYLRALKPKLASLLFLAPSDPTILFCPPSFNVAPPLPATIHGSRETPQTIQVPYQNLFLGHSRIVLTGPQDSGRTTTMVVAAWQSYMTSDQNGSDQTRNRLPIWIDLACIDQLRQDPEANPIEQLARLAVLFMPQLLPKWIIQQLTHGPTLILLDNWSSLSDENKQQVAAWVDDAAQSVEDPIWLVAAGEAGYGALTEVGFVPAGIVPEPDSSWLSQLIAGWAEIHAEDVPSGDGEEAIPGPDTPELSDTLDDVLETQAPLWEFHLRSALFFRTRIVAETPQDAMDRWIEKEMPLPTLGEEEADLEAAELAQQLAREVLLELARKYRLDGEVVDTRELRELVETYLPSEEDRHPKLESAVQRLLIDAAFLERQPDKTWRFSHPIWTEYFVAYQLSSTKDGEEIILDHLFDPSWSRIVSFYATQTDATTIVRELLSAQRIEQSKVLRFLRATQWAINSPTEIPWRQTLMKALAQDFMSDAASPSDRLIIGSALAQVAGSSARAFFLKMLQQPSLDVRTAAIRGLGWCGNPQDMRILGAALRDQNLDVRSAAVWSLRDMGTSGAATFLAKSLDQVDEALMLVIAKALAELPEGPQALIDAADHHDLLVRRAVAQGLGNIDQLWAEEKLVEMLKHDAEWLVRSAAESALEAKEDQEKQQATIPAPPKIDEIEWLITWAAEQGMGLGIGEAAIDTLVMAAQKGRDDVKVLSALTLARIGDDSHIPVLESMLADETSDSVQTIAMWGLQELQRRYPEPDFEREEGRRSQAP